MTARSASASSTSPRSDLGCDLRYGRAQFRDSRLENLYLHI